MAVCPLGLLSTYACIWEKFINTAAVPLPMSSKVYFAPMSAQKAAEAPINRIPALWEKAGFGKLFKKSDFVAVKCHFGEPGNTAFVQPMYLRRVIDLLRQGGQRPFLTDANTLYYGKRANAVDHLMTAHLHGFTPYSVDAPVIIADGLNGRDHVNVPIKGKHFKSVKIGSAAVNADGMISVAHVKGHLLSGFGGAFKNIGMGLGSRAGKQQMHSDVKPKINASKCKKCGRCAGHCPESAISLVGDVMKIDEAKCVGCGECVQNCYEHAIAVNWQTDNKVFQEKMVEYFMGAVKDKPVGYFNLVMNVSPDCDCMEYSGAYIVPDIGILSSMDPVAIDKASVDLINSKLGLAGTAIGDHLKEGDDKIAAIEGRGIEWEHQLKYAEELGLGSRKYELIRL